MKKEHKEAGEASKSAYGTSGVDYTEDSRPNTTGASGGAPDGIGIDYSKPKKITPQLAKKEDGPKKAFVSALVPAEQQKKLAKKVDQLSKPGIHKK